MTTDAVAASKCVVNTGGFDTQCFGFDTNTVASGKALVYRFEKTADTERYAVGDVISVVGIFTTSVGAGTNIVSSVTLAGASALVALATSGFVSAILF